MSRPAETNKELGRFLTGSTMGHVVRMTMTGAMGITFVFLVDAANLFWVSRLGEPQLVAAVGFAFAIQFFSVSVGIGLMIASNAQVARAIGEGNKEEARRIATSSAMIAFLIQSCVAATIIVFRNEIVGFTGARGETAALAARYLAFSVPSLSIMAISLTASGAIRAHGDGARSMYVTLTSGTVSMFVDPTLIYVMGLGLDGAAIGLNLSRCVMLVMALRFAIGTHNLFAPPDISDALSRVRGYLTYSLPAILTQLATPTGNYLMTNVMSQFGDEAVAGWAVVGRMTTVAFGGIFSLSGAIGGIFGQNFGARRFDRVQAAYRDAILFGLIYTLVTWLILFSTSGFVIQGFGLTPKAAEVVYAFVTVGVAGFVFASALFVSNAAFNALGRPARSTLVNWVRDGVLTWPFAILLAGWLGASGVIYAQALASAVVGSGAAWWGWSYVRHLKRQQYPPLDLEPARPYASADRFRRR